MADHDPEDGHMASKSEPEVQPEGQALLHPPPPPHQGPHGKGTSGNPQTRRIHSEVYHLEAEDQSHTTKILDLVHGQGNRLQWLKHEAKRKRKVERELQREVRAAASPPPSPLATPHRGSSVLLPSLPCSSSFLAVTSSLLPSVFPLLPLCSAPCLVAIADVASPFHRRLSKICLELLTLQSLSSLSSSPLSPSLSVRAEFFFLLAVTSLPPSLLS
ncbi:uncharacterized protein LOC110269215 [Arachis ipaensis]|uniref:uncharacterized protein LOC110269215 n=1 Tax=Arachis ipaensis TaxID=130454 RepID=UPI000A2B5A7F|nr:uncharacterized protein LOC110269215 [Arachis ipaensis]